MLMLISSSPDWSALPALLITSLAIMGSPGPATVSLTAGGVVFGVRRSLRYLAGVIAGTTGVLLAVAAGLTGALLAVPGVRPALIAVAVAYVLYLAYHIATAPPLASTPDAASAPSFAGGLLLGVANPKAWVAIAAVFISVRLSAHALADAALKTLALTAMIVLINTAWLVAGASVAPMLRDPARSRRVNAMLASVLVLSTAVALLH
jgi:threonine/homoserine/homoserine lactone efflux protein